jgi:hypothetical protein
MAYGTINADLMTTSDGVSSSGLYGFKNRIYNGQMVIDQRNAGAALTINASSNAYTVDRWVVENSTTGGVITAQQSSTAPAGFNYSLKTTVTTTGTLGTSGYLEYQYKIEGYNLADLNWGSANAKAITLSFGVQSSVAGTYGGSIANGGYNRSYSFLFTISSANTWEQKTVTIPGDTSGTWLTTNGIGAYVFINMGAGSSLGTTPNQWNASGSRAATGESGSIIGTNGATFYITGVQLEKGSTATSFDYRSYGQELLLCQRYFLTWVNGSGNIGLGGYYNSTYVTSSISFPVTMRAAPTLTQTTGTNYYGIYSNNTLDYFDSFSSGIQQATLNCAGIDCSANVSGTSGSLGRVVANSGAFIGFSAEL